MKVKFHLFLKENKHFILREIFFLEIQEEEDIEVKPPAPGIFSFSADLDQDKEEVNVDKVRVGWVPK